MYYFQGVYVEYIVFFEIMFLVKFEKLSWVQVVFIFEVWMIGK